MASAGRRAKFLAFSAAVAIAGGALLWWNQGNSQPAPAAAAPPAVPVHAVPVEVRNVPQASETIGVVQPLKSAELRPQVDGILVEILFAEGQRVEEGQLLARIDDRPYVAALAAAQADKAAFEAQLAIAEQDLQRSRALLERQATAQQAVDRLEAEVRRLRAAVQGSEAAIASAEVTLSFTRIVAPFAGRVGLRLLDAGNLVTAGSETGIVTLVQSDPISVVFTLPQDSLAAVLPLLSAPQPAPVLALDQAGGSELARGHLVTADNRVDAGTGAFRLRAEFANAGDRLWPGQFVTVRLQTAVTLDAVVVPLAAVRQGLDGPFVFRVADGKAQVTPVRLGQEDGDGVVVAEGLAAGDTVVVDGHSRLRNGTAVRLLEGAREPAGQAVSRLGGSTP